MMPSHKIIAYKHSGFSFVEMLMILTLLTVVSMPLLISMNAQNRELQKSDTQTTGYIAIDKLFDVVDPNIPLAARENFIIGEQVVAGKTPTYKTTTSVFCDPLSPAQDSDRCDEGPFFFRRYNLSPSDNKMTVEIGVSNKQNISDGADLSIYQRRYEINSYRLFPKATNFPLVESDALGQMWYQEAVVTEANRTNAPMAFTEKESTCSTINNPGNAISNRLATRIIGDCTPLYHFKVAPGSNYNLKLHFTNFSNPGLCQTTTDERSKHLVNISVQDMTGRILTERRNIDIGTKVRKEVNGKTQEQFFFVTPRNQTEIIVEPTVPPSCTGAFANISALELNRL